MEPDSLTDRYDRRSAEHATKENVPGSRNGMWRDYFPKLLVVLLLASSIAAAATEMPHVCIIGENIYPEVLFTHRIGSMPSMGEKKRYSAPEKG